MGLEFQKKLDLLGGGAADEVACESCAANPRASLVSHRATRPIPAASVQLRARDLRPWLANVVRSDGKRMPVVKTLMTSACEKDCFYCPTRRGRNRLRRETFQPEELAAGVDRIVRAGAAEGLFLSSGIIGGGTRTMSKTIAAVEILRDKFEFRGYVHLKLMPGAERAAIEQALHLANRVSVNLEAPNSARLARLSSTKGFLDELLAPLKTAREIIEADPTLRGKSMTTQFVVGAADETDREILSTTAKLYRQLQLARVYYSAFRPVEDTPLENRAPENPRREFRLYQADFMLRQYGFAFEELVLDACGNLPLEADPKTAWAREHVEHFPLELNRASREELLRVPGIGPKSADRILGLRRTISLRSLRDLDRLGADAKRASPFVLLNGRRPPQQRPLW